ncbi:hypothetical protein E2C01_070433 [Portunus trituberculatus]|uniref:Uncharacterized protein n=1 Tax=Portunus trituberculatus TaxID=210409 RepID=A0A5B7HXA6_PORTR|nr:hypothetical protein [Portunus trituberculatus]
MAEQTNKSRNRTGAEAAFFELKDTKDRRRAEQGKGKRRRRRW